MNGNSSAASAAALAARGADSLLAAFATGSAAGEAAFAEVVRRHAAAVFATCLRVTKNPHDAEDATQVTFLTLAVQARAGKPVAKLAPWLQRVAHRAALDLRRGRKRREAHELRHADERGRLFESLQQEPGQNGHPPLSSHPAPGDIDFERLGPLMAEELARLPARYRLPLASLYCAGLSRAEVAEELGLSLHALRVRVHRGRKMLATRLAARGVGPAGRLLSGGVLAAAVAAVAREALLRRVADAAVELNGNHLAAATAERVLAAVRTTALAAAVAKLKGAVGVTAVAALALAAAGGAAAGAWQGVEARLSPVLRQVIDAVSSPWRTPLPRPAQPPSLPVPMATNVPPPPRAIVREAVPSPVTPAQEQSPLASAAWASEYPAVTVLRPVASAAGSNRSATAATRTAPARESARYSSALVPVAASVAVPGFAAAPRHESADSAGSGAYSFTDAPPGFAAAGQTSSLSIAPRAGDVGAYTLHGGTLSTATLDVGRAGTGRFEQAGGTTVTSRLRLGADIGGSGEFDLAQGALVLRRPPESAGLAPGAGVSVGGAGRGAIHLGGGDSPGGAIFQPRGPDSPHPVFTGNTPPSPPPPSLVVRGDAAGTGLIEGWGGALGDGGAFVNNGRVVADGGGRDRELIFLGYGAVTNTIENPDANGTNGWFARNNGRLFLPKIAVAPGTHTYTWGEDAADPVIDLVNSARMTLHDALNPGKLDVSLLDKHRADVPALPQGHTFIGIWSIDTGLTKPAGGIDLVVRYDDGLASELNLREASLKLWQYEDGQWLRINDSSFSRDLEHHLLAGHSDGGLTYFAVSAPEPGACGAVLVAGAGLLLRRRRRRVAEPGKAVSRLRA